MNSIVSSPPIVSDREEFFGPQDSPEAIQEEGNREGREGMRETLRRAAEARFNSTSNDSGATAAEEEWKDSSLVGA